MAQHGSQTGKARNGKNDYLFRFGGLLLESTISIDFIYKS